jgi:hypothetical protein
MPFTCITPSYPSLEFRSRQDSNDLLWTARRRHNTSVAGMPTAPSTLTKETHPMIGLFRSTFLVCLILIAWTAPTQPANACPFCNGQGETLLTESELADMILFGRLKDPKRATGGDDFEGTTTLAIDTVVKDHVFRAGRDSITLPRYIPDTGDGKYKFLVFCTVSKNGLDPYKGLAVKADSDIAKYLTGMIKLQKAPIEKRLRFAFDYLDSADLDVSNDAYKEFSNADYKDYVGIAKGLPADKIAGWLKDEKNTPSFRYGLYGSMLGHCGKEEHAKLLHDMVSDPEKRTGSGVDGMLAGYVMLKPREGWDYVHGVLANRSNEFMFRYAALRTARFFHDMKTDVIKADDLVGGVAEMIAQKDIADLAIEDLRKWKRFELTDRILGLKDKRVFGLFPQPAYEMSIVRRAILRFALSARGNEAAAAYVAEMRKLNPAWVKEAEELLRLEQLPSK